jgi:tRNA pseudouridine55 synthase
MATRLLRFVEKTDKHYVGEVVLGTETSTLDAAGDVIATYDMSGVTLDDARRAVSANLTGAITQVPPMVSAIKVGGRPLHELAREGIEIDRAPRPVAVRAFDIEAGPEPGVLAIDVVCSAGTYVRTLAADLGRLLGGGAHLRNLRRLAVGEFRIEDARPPDSAALLPVDTAVRTLAHVVVDPDVAAKVANGRVLPRFEGDGPWAVFDRDRRLLAVYEAFRDTEAKPSVVLPTAHDQ